MDERTEPTERHRPTDQRSRRRLRPALPEDLLRAPRGRGDHAPGGHPGWKTRFGEFWPKGQLMFLPASGIAPGEVGLINASIPGTPTMSTGVLVIYADDESFSFMSPEGHPFAGPLTFSAYDDAGTTVVHVQELTRASDPLWELAMMTPVLGDRMQNDLWRQTLRNLASSCGVDAPAVESRIVCVDKRRQWRNAKNIWQNAGIRSGLTAPLRLFRRR